MQVVDYDIDYDIVFGNKEMHWHEEGLISYF